MGKCAHIGCINGKHVEFILQIRFVLLFEFFPTCRCKWKTSNIIFKFFILSLTCKCSKCQMMAYCHELQSAVNFSECQMSEYAF